MYTKHKNMYSIMQDQKEAGWPLHCNWLAHWTPDNSLCSSPTSVIVLCSSLVKNFTRSLRIFIRIFVDPDEDLVRSSSISCKILEDLSKIFEVLAKSLQGSFRSLQKSLKILQVPAKILKDPSGPCKDP